MDPLSEVFGFMGIRDAIYTRLEATAPWGWVWRSVLVRRSQRAQVRWDRLSPLLLRWIPQPRILHPYPDARFAATHPG